MHAQKWSLFLPETREENPLFGVPRKMRELAIFPVGIINNSRIWENNKLRDLR